MSIDTGLLVLRAAVLLAAFSGFAWALVAARRDNAANFSRLAAQHESALGEIQSLSGQLIQLSEDIRQLSLPSPVIASRSAPQAPAQAAVTPSGARGYEMAIRMARNGAGIEEIVASCGTTRAEARLLRRLHCAGSATAA